MLSPEVLSNEAPAPSHFASLGAELSRRMEARLAECLGEPRHPAWERARGQFGDLALRPAKRIRPFLLMQGYALATEAAPPSEPLLDFATGLELLHTFLLIHDDVADRAPSRRGGPSLYRALAPGSLGENLAIVCGDYLFARSLEVMLGCGMPRAAQAVRYFLGVCRQTAAGQYLDLALADVPLSRVSPLAALRVADLKTARYGFSAPLAMGAMLGGAAPSLVQRLSRIGRCAGLAFQLNDDLLGLFGDPRATGKSSDSDYCEGKRTFPLLAAYRLAEPAGRRALEDLWERPEKDQDSLTSARFWVQRCGGREATERAIARWSSRACAAARAIEGGEALARLLESTLTRPPRGA